MTGRHSCRRDDATRFPWTAGLTGLVLVLVLSLAAGALHAQPITVAAQTPDRMVVSSTSATSGSAALSGRQGATSTGHPPAEPAKHQHEMENHPAPVWSTQAAGFLFVAHRWADLPIVPAARPPDAPPPRPVIA